MPWTVAHAAAVLPVKRLAGARLSLAGLCLGSFAPDFGYYLPFIDHSRDAHSLVGVALVCVPGGIVLWVLLRWLHAPVAELLPQPHRAALLALPRLGPLASVRAWAVAALSIALGALTHIAWDAFTHGDGLAVDHIAALRAPLWHAFGGELRVYTILQHLSTFFGTACLVVAYAAFVRRQPPPERSGRSETLRRLGLAALLVAAMAGAALIALAQAVAGDGAVQTSTLVVRWVIWTTSLLAIGVAAAALLRRVVQRRAGT